MTSAIGIDIGGTNVRVARVSSAGTILTRSAERTSLDPLVLVERLIAIAAEVCDDSVIGIGVGIPGRVDSLNGTVVSGGYVDLSVVPLQTELRNRFGKTVVLDNDCNMALIGEAAFGAARGVSHAAMLTLGTGIGGALMENGEIVRGRRCAGQLGHIVIDPSGQACNCGRTGCLETTSSGTSFRRLIAEHGLEVGTTIETVISHADKNDPVAASVIRTWGVPLCMAIDTIASMLDPDIVLLGGGLGHWGWEIVRRLGRKPSWGDVCPVAPATLGDEAGIIGAALAAINAASEDNALPSSLQRAS